MNRKRNQIDILIYGINFEPEPIGVGKYTGELAKYLVERGYSLKVVTAPPHYPGWLIRGNATNFYTFQREKNIEIYRCPLLLRFLGKQIHRAVIPFTFAITSSFVLFYAICIRRPNVLLCIEPTLFCAPAALMLCKLFNIRTVLHVQDLEIDAAFAVGHLNKKGWTSKLAYFFERFCLSKFEKVITISDRMRESIISKGVPSGRVFTVRNWVDFSLFKHPANKARFRSALGIKEDRFVVAYSGSMGAKQDLETIFRAAEVLQHSPSILFVFAGEGPEKDRLTKNFEHLNNILILPLVPANEFSDFLSMADMHLVPQIRGISDLVLPSKIGSILASGGRLMVISELDSEIVNFTKDIAITVAPGDVDGIVDKLKHASEIRTYDREGSLKLGRTLDKNIILPMFEEILNPKFRCR